MFATLSSRHFRPTATGPHRIRKEGSPVLTKSRQAGSYRSQAGSVYEDLVDLRLNGEPTLPADGFSKRRVETVKKLLQVGPRRDDGSLDASRSSPEKLELDRELVDLIPKQLPDYAGKHFNMQRWVDQAVRVLDVVAQRQRLSSLADGDLRFVEYELEPFLLAVVSLGTEEPDVG